MSRAVHVTQSRIGRSTRFDLRSGKDDGKALYLMRADAPGKIWLLDLASGRKRLWKELQPPEPSAASGLFGVLITPDGQSYVHTYQRWLADLYVLDGLR